MPWLGTPETLARICALHHQRQLSNQLSWQFRGDILQVVQGASRTHQDAAR